MIFSLVVIFISIIFLFLRVAFITLLERILLALSQFRKGPRKVGIGGIIQPLIDGMKLLIKRQCVITQRFHLLLFVGPIVILIGISIVWVCLRSIPFHIRLWLGRLWLVLVLRLRVYGVLLVGLRRVSKYAFMGRIRACVQSVSYEVRLIFIVLSLILLGHHTIFVINSSIIILGRFPIWFIRYIAEVNRAPIDLAEGERELIRGFNVELRRVVFAFVLVGEYGIVVCLSWFTRVILLRGRLLIVGVWVIIRLIIRRVFPRFRYDKLILFCWICILPLSISWGLIRLRIGLF